MRELTNFIDKKARVVKYFAGENRQAGYWLEKIQPAKPETQWLGHIVGKPIMDSLPTGRADILGDLKSYTTLY